jgi:hypothetical protein
MAMIDWFMFIFPTQGILLRAKEVRLLLASCEEQAAPNMNLDYLNPNFD